MRKCRGGERRILPRGIAMRAGIWYNIRRLVREGMKSWMMGSFRMCTRGKRRRVREASYFLVPPPIAKDALRAHLQGVYDRGKTAAEGDAI
jgi:hypothetical protein